MSMYVHMYMYNMYMNMIVSIYIYVYANVYVHAHTSLYSLFLSISSLSLCIYTLRGILVPLGVEVSPSGLGKTIPLVMLWPCQHGIPLAWPWATAWQELSYTRPRGRGGGRHRVCHSFL